IRVLRAGVYDTGESRIDVIQEVDIRSERLIVPDSFDLMVLRDVTVHAEHEEPATLLAVIRKSVRLAEIKIACSEWLERTSEGRCCSDGVEHALDRWVDRIRKTLRSCEIEQVGRQAAIWSITEDAVLCILRENLASSHWRCFVQVEAFVVKEEIRFASTRVEHWTTTLTKTRKWNWTTEAAAKLVQAEFALRLILIVVLEVGCIETFIAVLPESSAVIVISSATSRESDTNSAVARAFRTGSRCRNCHFVDRVDARTNEGEESVGRLQEIILHVHAIDLNGECALWQTID